MRNLRNMTLSRKKAVALFLLAQLFIIGLIILASLSYHKWWRPQFTIDQNDIDAIKEEISKSRNFIEDYFELSPSGDLDPSFPKIKQKELGLNFLLEGKSSNSELKSLLQPFLAHVHPEKHPGSSGSYFPDSYAYYYWANGDHFIQIEAFSLSDDTTRIRYIEVLY